MKYGNFSSSDVAFGVGAVVEFSCDSGYTLEQGSVTIECVDAENPQWNETEPGCRGGWGSTRGSTGALGQRVMLMMSVSVYSSGIFRNK